MDNFFFDFDHTLIDTDLAFKSYRDALKNKLLEVTGIDQFALSNKLSITTNRLNSQFFAARLDLIEGIGFEFTEEQRRAIFIATRKAYYDSLNAGYAIVQMLHSLQQFGKSVFLFTGGSPAHTVDKLVGSGLAPFFDTVFTGARHPFEDEVKNGVYIPDFDWERVVTLSPDPKHSTLGYEEIIALTNVDPKNCVMIGDTASYDIENARSAGFGTAKATWFRNDCMESVTPDLVLESPQQLQALLFT